MWLTLNFIKRSLFKESKTFLLLGSIEETKDFWSEGLKDLEASFSLID